MRQPSRDSITESLEPLKLHVAPVQAPFVVLLQHHGAHQPRDLGVVGEDAHDVGPALDLGVQPLQRVGAVDLRPVRSREPPVFGASHKVLRQGPEVIRLIV